VRSRRKRLVRGSASRFGNVALAVWARLRVQRSFVGSRSLGLATPLPQDDNRFLSIGKGWRRPILAPSLNSLRTKRAVGPRPPSLASRGFLPCALGSGRQLKNNAFVVGTADPGCAIKIADAVLDQAGVGILAVRSAAAAVRECTELGLGPAATFTGRQLEDGAATVAAESCIVATTALQGCSVEIARLIEDQGRLREAAVVIGEAIEGMQDGFFP
jgi:hypothetical protein